MKKFFDEVERNNNDATIQERSKDYFMKKNLLKSVGDFTVAVLDAIEVWLFSFPTGMTKDAFKLQISKLEKDEAIALAQLKTAHGFRIIKKHVKEWDYPIADKSYAEFIASGKSFITIKSRSRKLCESYVMKAIKDLKQFGSVYVLDCAVLFANLKSLREKGCSDELISQARKCDFLIIENLDQEIGIVSKASSWAINTIVNERYELGKPILARHNDWIENVTELYNKCTIHELEEA